MKRFVSVALVFVMLLVAMPFAAFAEYDYPYAGDAYGVDFDQASTVFEEGDIIALFGDSITHGSTKGSHINTSWFVQLEYYLATRYPALRVKTKNFGIGGINTVQVADIQIPKDAYAGREFNKAIVYLGTNDGNNSYNRSKITTAYTKVLDFIMTDRNAKPIALITPVGIDFVTTQNIPSGHNNTTMKQVCDEVIKVLGMQRGIPVAYQWDDFNATQVNAWEKHQIALMQDQVHPSARGSSVTFATLIETLNLPGEVATVVVDAANGAVTKQGNCTVSDLVTSEGRVKYTYLANALPFANTSYVQEGTDIMEYVEKFSRETLKVEGLPSDTYSLIIDGFLIDTLTAEELAQGVNLALYNTPMVKQSKTVADKLFTLTEEQRHVNDIEYALFHGRQTKYSGAMLDMYMKSMANTVAHYKTYADAVAVRTVDEWWAYLDTLWDDVYNAAQPTAHTIELVGANAPEEKPDTPDTPDTPDAPKGNMTPVIIAVVAVVAVAAVVVVLVVLKKKKK